MKYLKLLFCLVILAMLCVSGSSQTVKTTTSQAESKLPDDGAVNGSTYSNKYFGLTLTIPPGWDVQGQDVKQGIKERGKVLVTSEDPTKREELDKALDNTINLLTLSQAPVEPNPAFKPLLIALADKVPAGAPNMTDAEYFSALKNTFQYSQVPITLEKDIYLESVGATSFSVIGMSLDFKGVIVRQKYYAHVKKGYALCFILSFQKDDQLRALEGILRSAVLQ